MPTRATAAARLPDWVASEGVIELREVLAREGKQWGPELPGFREDVCEGIGCERMELVDVREEIRAPLFRDIRSRCCCGPEAAYEKRSKEQRGIFSDSAFPEVHEQHARTVHNRSQINRAAALAENVSKDWVADEHADLVEDGTHGLNAEPVTCLTATPQIAFESYRLPSNSRK